jgi:branched-chain amino acid transport system substrate-binding protein
MRFIKNGKEGRNMLNFLGSNSGKMRKWQRVGLEIIVISFLAAVGFGHAAAAEKGPITIAFMAELTGGRAQVGEEMVAGFKMFLEEVNYTAAGRTIKLLVDDHGDPTVALTKARRFINRDNVAVVSGIWSTPVVYALIPLLSEAKVALVVSGVAGDDVTQRQWTKNVVRVNAAGCQVGHVAGDYAYHKLGWRRVAILSWQHAFGQETVGAFQRVFEEAGGKVVQRIYCPRDTLDFGPYVSRLKSDADGLFEVVTASPSLNFFKALKATGLMDKWKVLSVLSATDESFLQELGDNGLGVLTVNNYSAVLETPENVKFREKVLKKTGREVTGPLMDSYVAAKWTVKAIEAVNGDVENRDKFHDALQKVTISDSPHGPLSVDSRGNVVSDIYIRRVDKVKGRYQNTVVDTYPKVSQFWKYDPGSYLKAPTYSDKNPPCKYCE